MDIIFRQFGQKSVLLRVRLHLASYTNPPALSSAAAAALTGDDPPPFPFPAPGGPPLPLPGGGPPSLPPLDAAALKATAAAAPAYLCVFQLFF